MRKEINRFRELMNYKHGYISESTTEKEVSIDEEAIGDENAKALADSIWSDIEAQMPSDEELLNMVKNKKTDA